jgi:hypothetical protein
MQNELQDGKLLLTSRANWEKKRAEIRVASGLEVTTEQWTSPVDLRFQKILRIFDRVPGIPLMPKSYPIDPCTERHLLLFKNQ